MPRISTTLLSASRDGSSNTPCGSIKCGPIPVRGPGPEGPRTGLVRKLLAPGLEQLCTRPVRAPPGPVPLPHFVRLLGPRRSASTLGRKSSATRKKLLLRRQVGDKMEDIVDLGCRLSHFPLGSTPVSAGAKPRLFRWVAGQRPSPIDDSWTLSPLLCWQC